MLELKKFFNPSQPGNSQEQCLTPWDRASYWLRWMFPGSGISMSCFICPDAETLLVMVVFSRLAGWLLEVFSPLGFCGEQWGAEEIHEQCLVIFAAQAPRCCPVELPPFLPKEPRPREPRSTRAFCWGRPRTVVGLGGSRAGGAVVPAGGCYQSTTHRHGSLLQWSRLH